MALCIVSVGGTKTGKTTFAINFLLQALKKGAIREIWANDVQREYKYRVQAEKNKKFKCFHGSFDGFLNDVLLKYNYQGSHRGIIMDEAGDYCPHGQGIAEVKSVFRAKRFNANIYILNFHDLGEVPTYVIRFADYFSIGPSAGVPGVLSKKFEAYPHIYETWLKTMNEKLISGVSNRYLVKK